ncbi:methylated-DNA--[protein]-cysteine S-methyltransferase [Irregularibacter muris]|uniref:methylated-DNA--[protein]-cysteine S-methyltransferase n=1 Tax=Irregularibacter muris TaxID=1796619 RepID=A0AAE3L4H8_9FIRM|nr:methylated-DNA--[protein]-cysteine S-methyltransferase [Irregularibacter muris]MCR1900093.1 methylated-DNA--[protein]-cysteine S-methyltransferase [Irregularibacter muris]
MIKYAFYNFKFGFLKIGYRDKVILSIEKVNRIEEDGERSKLSDLAYSQICEYLEGVRKSFDFQYAVYGTKFQEKVWDALGKIPYGETRTYKEIAEMISSPKASRAVGIANNKNPIIIVIPCHRVIKTDGSLAGYVGGLDMKKTLLKIEKGDEANA